MNVVSMPIERGTIADFVYAGQPTKVVFGAGSLAHLEREIDALGMRRALVLSTPGQMARAHSVAARLGPRAAGVFAKAVMHVPIETAIAARHEAQRLGADGAIAFGGGSTIGLGKAIALTSGLPILAIPTTYAGSEMTPIFGLTEAGQKRTGRDPRVLPRTVIYDPELTLGLPPALSVTSGLNALAHAAEGLYAQDGNPLMKLVAQEGIRAMAAALPVLFHAPSDIKARSTALYGAWLCAMVLGNVGMALHHKLCHVLGGSFNLPHAEVHAVILPHALAYNVLAAPDAMSRLQAALSTARPCAAIFDLAHDHGAPSALRDLGLPEEMLDHAAELVLAQPHWNPQPVTREGVRQLLQHAWEGQRPNQ